MVILALGMTMCLLVTACGTSGTVDKKTDDTSKTERINKNQERRYMMNVDHK